MAQNIGRLASIHKTSEANEDLLSKKVVSYDESYIEPRVRKIDIMVSQDCHLVINGHSRIKVLSSLGLFTIGYDDMILESLVIEEAGILVYAVIGY